MPSYYPLGWTFPVATHELHTYMACCWLVVVLITLFIPSPWRLQLWRSCCCVTPFQAVPVGDRWGVAEECLWRVAPAFHCRYPAVCLPTQHTTAAIPCATWPLPGPRAGLCALTQMDGGVTRSAAPPFVPATRIAVERPLHERGTPITLPPRLH